MKAKSLIVSGLVFSLTFIAHQTSAQFTEFENFNSLTSGPLNGQGGWNISSGASAISVTSGGSFESGNYAQVNEGATGTGDYQNGLGILGSSTAATVFFQFCLPGIPATPGNVTAANVTSMNFCIDQDSTPTDVAGTSSAQFNYDNNNGNGLFRIRAGAAGFVNAAASADGTAIAPITGATYDLWYVLDANTATYQLYLEDASAATDGDTSLETPTLLYGAGTTTSTLGFRTSDGYDVPGAALTTFNMGPGSTTGSVPQTEVGDIYVDTSGEDLSNPLIAAVPEPNELALIGISGGAFLYRMRRNRHK
jgi:hypothetical protein